MSRTLTGIFTGPLGTALANTLVELIATRSEAAEVVQSTSESFTTDGAGAYSVVAKPGYYKLLFTIGGRVIPVGHIMVETSATPTDINALLAANGTPISTAQGILDDAVAEVAKAAAEAIKANTEAINAQTARTDAETARTGAESAQAGAQTAEANAVAVVSGGTASIPPAAGKIPIAGATDKIDDGWLSYNIPALSAQYPGLNVVATCFYDTSLDSDGGAWIHKTDALSYGKEAVPSGMLLSQKLDGESWATYAARISSYAVGDWYYDNGDGLFYEVTGVGPDVVAQIYRAGSATFPAQVLITVDSTADNLIMLDASGPELTMWMVFSGSASRMVGISAGAVQMKEGILCLANGGDGLAEFNFITEATRRYITGGYNQRGDGIVSRNINISSEIAIDSNKAIVSNSTNAVAITVLDSAPVDQATGLKIPTVAVATDGGISVIKDDGNVWDISGGFGAEIKNFVQFDSNNDIVTSGNWLEAVAVFPIPSSDITYSGKLREYTHYTASPLIILGVPGAVMRQAEDNYVINSLGLTTFHENPADPAKGMVAHITAQKNTGWMVGDCQLAALCEAETGSLVEAERVANGDFTTDVTGWIDESSGTGSISAAGAVLNMIGGAASTAGVSQSFITVIDKAYRLKVDKLTGICIVKVGTAQYGTQYLNGANDGVDVDLVFIATTTTTWLNVINNQTSTATADTISLKEVVEDHSGNGNHLDIKGTLSRAVVGTGEIAAFSGFSSLDATNRLSSVAPGFLQSIASGGDFYLAFMTNATSDFFISTAGTEFYYDYTGMAATDEGWGVGVTGGGGSKAFTLSKVTAGVRASVLGGITWPEDGNPHHVVVLQRSSGIEIWIDGVLVGSTGVQAFPQGSEFSINRVVSTAFWFANLRVGYTAPTADQIRKMARDELAMFEGKALLAGNDPDIKALTYDQERDLLHAASAGVVSSFRGLERVSSKTPSVGTITSLGAQNGALLLGGTNGVDADLPAISIRERLAKALPKAQKQREDFLFTGDGTITDFALPKGWKPKRTYVDGSKKREGSAEDYSVKYDGFVYSVSFAVAPANLAEIDVEAIEL